MPTLDPKVLADLLAAQRNEITEYHLYTRLAKKTRDNHNRDVLARIASDELRHHNFWQTYTQTEAKPKMFMVWIYLVVARTFGLTFGVKLMEKGEGRAKRNYHRIAEILPAAKAIAEEEDKHEQELLGMLQEQKLQYIGSIVLGLNDALVELTGALAGLTFALQHTRLIALTGFITGVAASFSMAASEYLSIKAETSHGHHDRHPLRAAVYTGITYIITVFILILPFILIANVFTALVITLMLGIIIIALFNFYASVAQGTNFKRRFLEMALLSLGVSLITFTIGVVVRLFWQIEI
ncbi:VIT1/CCC1 transporter family protein [Candidatus Falkowbacteria bacterium]|nr:VIT1/CCC1 transporter family protein [Candidatus Falkowbacteria bacterium]